MNSYDAVTYGVLVLGLVAINAYGYARKHYDAEVKARRDVSTVRKYDFAFLSTWRWWGRVLLIAVAVPAWFIFIDWLLDNW